MHLTWLTLEGDPSLLEHHEWGLQGRCGSQIVTKEVVWGCTDIITSRQKGGGRGNDNENREKTGTEIMQNARKKD